MVGECPIRERIKPRMNEVYYAVTKKAVMVWYRRSEDAEEAQCMADNLARSLKRLAIIQRVRSRPYLNAKGEVVKAIAA